MTLFTAASFLDALCHSHSVSPSLSFSLTLTLTFTAPRRQRHLRLGLRRLPDLRRRLRLRLVISLVVGSALLVVFAAVETRVARSR